VRLLATRIDGQVAAFALYLLDARTLHIYSNMVAPEWLTYSAGTITKHAVVAWACVNDNVEVVDWGLAVQRCKLSGPIALEPLSRVEIYSSCTETAVLTARSMRLRSVRFLAGANDAIALARWPRASGKTEGAGGCSDRVVSTGRRSNVRRAPERGKPRRSSRTRTPRFDALTRSR